MDHIMYMRNIGYGNNKVGILALAMIYAVSLGKIIKGKDSGSLFSNCWSFGFLGRWQDLKVSKPQSLAMNRPESASRKNLNKYFKELHAILTKAISMTNLKKIYKYNIDETGFSIQYSPLKVICDKNTQPQAGTSNKSTFPPSLHLATLLGIIFHHIMCSRGNVDL